MSVRSSMTALITRTRLKIGDPAGGSAVFTDQEVQDALDNHRREVRYEELRYAPLYTTTGTEYHDFYSAYRDWESDVALSNGAGTAYTPNTSEEAVGHWAFTASQTLPVYAVGKVYDIPAAAVELAQAWLAKLKLEYDFSTAGDSFSRSQKIEHLQALIAEYKASSAVETIDGERSDWRVSTWQ